MYHNLWIKAHKPAGSDRVDTVPNKTSLSNIMAMKDFTYIFFANWRSVGMSKLSDLILIASKSTKNRVRWEQISVFRCVYSIQSVDIP